MKTEKRNRNSILRAVFVAVSLLLQIGWMLLVIFELNNYSTCISLVTSVLASVVVLRLYSKQTTSAYKIPWIMLIMALPVMGLSLYLITEVAVSRRSMRYRLRAVREESRKFLPRDDAVMASLEQEDLSAANQFRYVSRYNGSPLWRNTDVRYFGHCPEILEQMKADLEKAEKFIFMEYFILEDGESFAQLRQILTRKAAQGVEVRLMYDDIGSIGKTNLRFARELNGEGVRCAVFNPALPFLNVFMNHRDHRKITVIDGKVAYTGGYNLADEYFGFKELYGRWKDTGIRLEGEAVRSLTATFLELWAVTARQKEPIGPYLDICHSVPTEGYVQPFGDDPLGPERVAENVYLNLIGHGKRYVWFMTPYLIITEELTRALTLAARRGVDVRIITPGIPDQRAVYGVTRSYYAALVSRGVRIFEYSPGFCHGKQCIVDGEMASIGTSNLDFRSLYLHYENDVLLRGTPAVKQMEADMEQLFLQCREVTESYRSTPLRIWQCILRLFAPLL